MVAATTKATQAQSTISTGPDSSASRSSRNVVRTNGAGYTIISTPGTQVSSSSASATITMRTNDHPTEVVVSASDNAVSSNAMDRTGKAPQMSDTSNGNVSGAVR